jgi:N-acetylmuramic acid 6-phosphate etherase
MGRHDELEGLTTEAGNPAAAELDAMDAAAIVALMNREDRVVAEAVGRELQPIARAVEAIAERLRRGGRLVYQGAGTSGRLGVLDAAECPPTFRAGADEVIGVIAGGDAALTGSVEEAEDDPEAGAADLAALGVGERDVVVGIAASGRTPYVLGGLEHGRARGALTIALSCNSDSPLAALADIAITPVVGPEVLAGSTRLKAGTATKMVLNMLSTGAMVRNGKAYGNRMVDVTATNAKLRARAERIVREVTGLAADAARELLETCRWEVKTALVSQGLRVPPAGARARLAEAGGSVREALARR